MVAYILYGSSPYFSQNYLLCTNIAATFTHQHSNQIITGDFATIELISTVGKFRLKKLKKKNMIIEKIISTVQKISYKIAYKHIMLISEKRSDLIRNSSSMSECIFV